MSERKDRRLGMGCRITRRDFLNGVAIGAGGFVASDPMLAALLAQETAPEKAPGYYPPALTGMRGITMAPSPTLISCAMESTGMPQAGP